MNKKVSLGIEYLDNKTLLSAVPNDILVNSQWGLKNISAYQAWQYGTGSRDEVVAVLDSGFDLTNKDLINNLWTNPNDSVVNGVDADHNGFINDNHGWNFIDNNNDIQDKYGHGSHVAGIIGAEGDNGIGVVGVNWSVSIMPLKVISDQGIGYTDAIIRAIDYIDMMKQIYHVNIVAVNASWGGIAGYSQILYDKINKLNSDGIVFVAAAGNAGIDTDIYARYPTCYDLNNIISVGALNYDGVNLASFSNYGQYTVDIAAPGSNILSTIPYNSYGYMAGTSMAAPFVAGTVALLNSIKPNLSISSIKNAIFSSVDRVPELFGKTATGGKLNIEAAVDSILGIPYDHNHTPVGSITFQNLRTISGWANDPDVLNSPISIKLIIDGAEKSALTTGTDGRWGFNLGGLMVGDHVIDIKAKDVQTGVWSTIASTHINIPAPIVRVGFLSRTRIAGWAFSERSEKSPVLVKVIINGKVMASQLANKYQPALVTMVGSAYHGFNIRLNRFWFHKGSNEVKIQVFDPISKQVSECWSTRVNR